MSSLINGYLKIAELKKIDPKKIIRGEKEDRIPISISVNEESNYGNNCGIYVYQNKEERDAKKRRHYLGNGSVVWTDGTIVLGQKDNKNNNNNQSGRPIQSPFPEAEPQSEPTDFDDLPF